MHPKLSPAAKDFILSLGALDANDRLTSGEALEHPFISRDKTKKLTVYVPEENNIKLTTKKIKTTLKLLTLTLYINEKVRIMEEEEDFYRGYIEGESEELEEEKTTD